MKPRLTDEDLDRLLAAPVRQVPPGLAERVASRLAADPGRRRAWTWYLVPALAAAGFALLVTAHRTPAPAAADYETLFALEDSLAPAGPLLDPLNRELCAEIPVKTSTP